MPRPPSVVLASTSPQRSAILEQLGIPFEVIPPRYEEHDLPGLSPAAAVRAHAEGKARSVLRRGGRPPGAGRGHGGRGDGPRLRQALRRARGARDARRPRRPGARGDLRALPPRPGRRVARARHDPCGVPSADRAADRRLPVHRRMGRPRRRLCDPGPRRVAGEPDRGRLPERRRSSRRAARRAAGRAFPRRLRLRLADCGSSSATPYT